MPEEIKEMLKSLGQLSIEEYYEEFLSVEAWLNQWEQKLKPKSGHMEEIDSLCRYLTADLGTYPAWMKIHLLSFCMKLSERRTYAEWLTAEVRNAGYDEIGEYAKYYLYWQIVNCVFENSKLQSEQLQKAIVRLYLELYQAFYRALRMERYPYIPIEERNQESVVVFTAQLLDEMHAPTKTLYDRCYYMQKYLGKKVTIINTAMTLVQKGDTPFYNRNKGVYNSELSDKKQIVYKGETFAFYQCRNDMPDLQTMQSIIDWVAKERPYCILHIGGGDLCVDLCGNIVPQITISTVFSGIATSCGTFQMVGRNLEDADAAVLQIMGCKVENVIRTLFTFVFKEQTHHYNREELGLSAQAKVLLITGWRLDREADDSFLQMIEDVLNRECETEVVFMGLFDSYEEKVKPFSNLQKRSHYLRFQEDALAVTECCDIYVNPKRKGGGSSAAEALYKGLPVVTLPFGDVAAAAGESFCVADYGEMADKICKYLHEEGLYQKMSEQAREMAIALMDSRTSFCEAFEKIEKMPDFR